MCIVKNDNYDLGIGDVLQQYLYWTGRIGFLTTILTVVISLYLKFDVHIWFRCPKLQTDHVILLYLNGVPTHNITNIDFILVHLGI